MTAWRLATDRKAPRLRRRLVRMAKKPSTALCQEAEDGLEVGHGGALRPNRGARRSNRYVEPNQCFYRDAFEMAVMVTRAMDSRAWEASGLQLSLDKPARRGA